MDEIFQWTGSKIANHRLGRISMQNFKNRLSSLICRGLIIANAHKLFEHPPRRVVSANFLDLRRFNVGGRPAQRVFPCSKVRELK
jgi:hypothetical protein